jgi:predicted esterase
MRDRLRSLTTRTWILAGAACFLLLALGVWGIPWLTHERSLLPEAQGALESDAAVTVTREPWLTFVPTEGDVAAGFIFYPGGRIAPEGYAPLMRAFAAEGYLVVVPDMPLNIAAFRPAIADKIVAAHPAVEVWAIGGHSVGGAMAALYTANHPERIAGLAIWASYPPDSADLSALAMPVTLIYGSRETRVTDSSVAERRHLLPEDTVYVRIEGGDHHQFGAYVIDPDEHRATISREAQHAAIIRATLELLARVR